MNITLKGHAYKYAVEQLLLTVFPGERPVYVSNTTPGAPYVQSSLSIGGVYVTSVTRLCYGGELYTGTARRKPPAPSDKLTRDRLFQKLIKLSFYRAAVKATGRRPPWGALTGIRPGKLVTAMLEAGLTDKAACRTMEREYDVARDRAVLCLGTAKAGLQVKRALAPRDICLYVGIPFCPTRCAYCSFVSNCVEKSFGLVAPFLDALFQEIAAVSKLVGELSLRVISVYIGGGTPTTLSASQLSALFSALRTSFDLSQVREYTVEAGRPDTLTEEKLGAMRAAGVTRVSVNPQTMQGAVLKAIGRKHTAEDVTRAVALVRSSGQFSLNMDLIAGLPSDTAAGFQGSLDQVLDFGAENVTVHTLSLKKGARITEEGARLPTPEQVGEFLEYAARRLRDRGYSPYYLYRQKYISGGFENVGWARPGAASLYNVCIMEELSSILSLGGGASTKLVSPKTGKIERIFNPKYPYEYIHGIRKVILAKNAVTDFYKTEVFANGI